MDKELKAKLTFALRSGEYPQGRDCLLNDEGRYCCLGVAAKVFGYQIDTKNDFVLRPGEQRNKEETSYSALSDFGLLDKVRGHLIGMNDSGSSFEEIADYIEHNL